MVCASCLVTWIISEIVAELIDKVCGWVDLHGPKELYIRWGTWCRMQPHAWSLAVDSVIMSHFATAAALADCLPANYFQDFGISPRQ